jgi:type VI secretion system secreted protein Hcp
MKSWIRSWMFIVCLAGMIAMPLSEAHAALNAYLKMKGQKQGQIKGSVSKSGREGAIEVLSVSHEIVSPRDAASGLPTGKRQHKPFVIQKAIDKSTPMLALAWSSNETLQTWELDFYQPGAKGVETPVYSIKLTNANIASIRLITDANGNLKEEIMFTYQKIEWTWKDGSNITAMDDWESPIAKSN